MASLPPKQLLIEKYINYKFALDVPILLLIVTFGNSEPFLETSYVLFVVSKCSPKVYPIIVLMLVFS
jgi:hypothetical protein